jgi:hypothetical protein
MIFKEIDAANGGIENQLSKEENQDFIKLSADAWVENNPNRAFEFNFEKFFLLLGTGGIRIILLKTPEQKIIGFQVWENVADYIYGNDSITYLRAIYIDKNYRDQYKLAKMYMQKGLQFAIDKDYKIVGSHVYDTDIATKKILELVGFKSVGILYHYKG